MAEDQVEVENGSLGHRFTVTKLKETYYKSTYGVKEASQIHQPAARPDFCSLTLTTTTAALMTTLFRYSSRFARTPPCRRLLLAQFITPNSFLSPLSLSLSDKSLSRRTFVSTPVRRAATAPTPPANPAVLRRSPTAEDIEAAELDVELLPQSDVQLALTERAAEVRRHFTSSNQRLMYRPWMVATLSNIISREALGLGPAGSRRVGRVPWIPIQNGAHTAARPRGLVRPYPSSSFSRY